MVRKALLLIKTIVIVSSLAGCTSLPAIQTSRLDLAPRLAVISAFERELEKLRAEAKISATHTINGRRYYVGQLAGNEVVLLLSGVSMVNAAMTTQTLLDHFNVRGIVFSGIAGGVNPNLNVGDVTIPARWGEYQEHVFAKETPQGWDPGRAKEFGNFGMMFPQRVSVTRKDAPPDSLERRYWFESETSMLDAARRVAGSVHLNRCTPKGECLNSEPKVVVGGNGVSGPTFVDNTTYRTWVWETFQADALDMETAAVAHVAYVNRVPFIAFRSLSDLAGGGPGKNEGAIFGRLAADNSAAVVIEYLKVQTRK